MLVKGLAISTCISRGFPFDTRGYVASLLRGFVLCCYRYVRRPPLGRLGFLPLKRNYARITFGSQECKRHTAQLYSLTSRAQFGYHRLMLETSQEVVWTA
jgi:hypothetical protein